MLYTLYSVHELEGKLGLLYTLDIMHVILYNVKHCILVV